MLKIPVKQIRVESRFRKDKGDLRPLAKSMADLGLLHPVVVTPDYRLIAGERRLNAASLLGWETIPATILDLEDIVRAEHDENAVRKEFLPSEAVAIAKALEPIERDAAKERQEESRANRGGNFTPRTDIGKSLDKVSAAVGLSRPTLTKATAVVEAAEREPGRFGLLVQEMDRTGKVDGAYRKLQQAKDEETILATPVVSGKYRTLVIDPPWDYEGMSLAGRGMPEYAVMSREELLALPVGDWAEADCHLYLWTTNNFLTRAVELVGAWGFQYKTVLTWVKPRIGLGSYFRNSTEQVLFAIRGGVSTRVKDIPTHFEAPVGEHSEKPEQFFRVVERASYPTYLEAFARRPRSGWEVWGNARTTSNTPV